MLGENDKRNLRNIRVDVGTLNVEGTGVERLKGGLGKKMVSWVLLRKF